MCCNGPYVELEEACEIYTYAVDLKCIDIGIKYCFCEDDSLSVGH